MASRVTEPRPSDSSPAAGAAAGTGGPAPSDKRRKGLSEKNRPLWLLIPGGFLMTIVILIPLAMGIWMSVIDLDQYSLRRWVSAEFIGIQNYIEAATSSDLLRSIWLSVSFAVISTLVTIPLGVAAAVVTQNAYRGRALVRSIFLIPYVLPSFVVASVWRTMLQPDGIVNVTLTNMGMDGGLWLNAGLG